MSLATLEQDHWQNQDEAMAQLGFNFTICKGVIKTKLGYQPTQDDYSALDYLFREWDYEFELS